MFTRIALILVLALGVGIATTGEETATETAYVTPGFTSTAIHTGGSAGLSR